MRHTLLSLLLILLTPNAHAQLLINEVMQSNIDCLMDDRNEFPDSWIELYNAGTSAVNINTYRIGTDSQGLDACSLPSRSIASGGRVILYADKESGSLHLPFRLETGKGATLFLFHLDGTIADRLTIAKKQPAPNIAYGRVTDGSATWGYLVQPTPGAPNCGRVSSQLLPDPIFSECGRVLTSSQQIQLTLSLPEGAPEGTQIRYTVDGSEPTSTSPLYVSPLTVNTTRIIRAKPFCDGYLSPRATTHSYLFLGRDMTLPVISITTNQKYFYDNKLGIYVEGTYDKKSKNYEHDWRRPINLEFFDLPDHDSQLNQLCETRIQGGASRGAKYKSLAIYAHKRFGEKRFAYEFFPDQRPGETNFKSLILRNAGNDGDYLYMRDAIIQRTMATNVDLDWQAWRPAIIYINGTYTGILNIRERSNADNILTNYDGLEDIDMIENWSSLKEGTMDKFREFKAFYEEKGHTWQEYAQLMDLDEYLNLMIMNLYYCNLDFPGNNIMMWRPRTDEGRWRFVAKDTDFGLGLYGRPYTYETIRWIYDPTYDPSTAWANKEEDTRLFRHLMDDPTFKREFIDRCCIYMGTFLNHDGTWQVWEPMYQMIRTEYPTHRKLINQWWPNYNDELNAAKTWLRNRTTDFYKQIGRYFNLGSPLTLLINQQLTDVERDAITVTFNDVPLTGARFTGKFFAGREIRLSGAPRLDDDGRPVSATTVTGWRVIINGKTTYYDTPQCRITLPGNSSAIATAILGQQSGIEHVNADVEASDSHAFYDLMGRPLTHPHGIVISRQKNR